MAETHGQNMDRDPNWAADQPLRIKNEHPELSPNLIPNFTPNFGANYPGVNLIPKFTPTNLPRDKILPRGK